MYFCSCFNKSHTPISQQLISKGVSCPEQILCSELEVYDLLIGLDISKATGHDGISCRMLKNTAASIAPSLENLFNLSLNSTTLPTSWKKSCIVPIPNNQDLSNPSNYRPVSLLPIVSKILEHRVYMLVMKHLQINHPLSAFQWRFLEGRSTALLHITDQWFQALETGNDICTVFFDFRKAFDSVPHSPLMTKLSSLELPLKIYHWINNYLSNRSQAVVVNGSQSLEAPVLSGVPQGSVLGPLLFLIYIDDLPEYIRSHGPKVNLFADDILLYQVIANSLDYYTLQTAISLIEEWSTSNFLSFNASKCKYRTSMQGVDCYKYLVLLISSNLSSAAHVDSICSKTKKILGLLYRRYYKSANQDTIKQLYLSLVRPHLDYACQVWDPHLEKDKRKLESVQKFGCRLAAHRWDASYQELLDLFDLQPSEKRRLHLKLGLLFKIVHRLCYFPTVPQFRADTISPV